MWTRSSKMKFNRLPGEETDQCCYVIPISLGLKLLGVYCWVLAGFKLYHAFLYFDDTKTKDSFWYGVIYLISGLLILLAGYLYTYLMRGLDEGPDKAMNAAWPGLLSNTVFQTQYYSIQDD